MDHKRKLDDYDQYSPRTNNTIPSCLSGQAPDFNAPKRSAVEIKFAPTREEDPRRLEVRLKQIQYGKNTVGYDNYIAAIPKYV